VEDVLQRAAAYALLARALAYPDETTFAALKETAAMAADWLEGTPLEVLVRQAMVAEREPLQEAYVRNFTLSSSPDCPTFETAFLSIDAGQQTHRMADIAGFYRAFGVDPAAPGYRPDDLPVELEFMGYLCRKELFAKERLGAPRVQQTLRAERMFLREHLGRWASPLGRRIAIHAMADPFYFAAGEALSDWLEAECERLGTGPLDFVDMPAMEWEAPGSDSDGMDDSNELISFDEIPVV
jgi:TorA maturation chaperone TorD